ncbi:hypothetical protein [Aridibaculum aurantiacum]|uniref:hypothetical protein n=1 Tax=Aridibaculum aurantiacum TaxID=2810307 RepID=UPI001A9648AB|nr:hypothetical protein [Aridibaculum aurantiacum]
MRKFLLVSSVLLGLSISSSAQIQDGVVDQKPAKVVFVEAGGPGLLSINYDMRLGKRKDGFGVRAGVGGWSLKDSRLLFVPIGANYITSKNQRDYFEAGAGYSIVSNSSALPGETGPFKRSFGYLNIGYRKQPSDGGWFYKAALVPVFGDGFFWPYWVGAGLGYTF